MTESSDPLTSYFVPLPPLPRCFPSNYFLVSYLFSSLDACPFSSLPRFSSFSDTYPFLAPLRPFPPLPCFSLPLYSICIHPFLGPFRLYTPLSFASPCPFTPLIKHSLVPCPIPPFFPFTLSHTPLAAPSLRQVYISSLPLSPLTSLRISLPLHFFKH